jgi:phosphate/sulfate permease
MSRKLVYLILAIIGFILPYYFLISFLMTHGLAARVFLNQLIGTPISTFFATDLLISCVVFMKFLKGEAERHAMKHQWVYWISLLTVGLSFALPLFLWAREGYLESRAVDA